MIVERIDVMKPFEVHFGDEDVLAIITNLIRFIYTIAASERTTMTSSPISMFSRRFKARRLLAVHGLMSETQGAIPSDRTLQIVMVCHNGVKSTYRMMFGLKI